MKATYRKSLDLFNEMLAEISEAQEFISDLEDLIKKHRISDDYINKSCERFDKKFEEIWENEKN